MEELKGFGCPAYGTRGSSMSSCGQQSMIGVTHSQSLPELREKWDLSTMEDSSYNCNCTDQQHCLSKSKSNPSLAIGSFLDEDSIDWKDTTSSEDSNSECSSCHFLPPAQESRETEAGRMPFGRRQQIQHGPEKLCEPPIVQAVEASGGSHQEDSRATLDLSADYQRMQRINQNLGKLRDLTKGLRALLDKEKDDKDGDPVFSDSPLDEALPPGTTSASPQMDHGSGQEHEASQALPKWEPPENEHLGTCPDSSPGLEEEEPLEIICQETGSVDSLSVSAGQAKEGDPPAHSESTSCLNIRSIMHWLRKRVASSLPGRKRPEAAYKDTSLLEPKKRCFIRGKRIQPHNPST
ncbi:uncharacterized protein C12orf71 homolog [Sciurus carolinensis]|uniref:uncharacterized protein C12orf71 homolog n=1 Tax=Sciurus carolinensis TaxID=30640 RepID=UPI001FB258C3|nr:uncharacterized protein C12orf71 homolog [Sciurus carolinensis]XP_047405698.1 uncharacterized protein C12orf71 homolog [Sciurus carolinensis]